MAMNMHVRIANVLGKQGGPEHVRHNEGRSHLPQGHLAVGAFNARAHSSIYMYIYTRRSMGGLKPPHLARVSEPRPRTSDF